MRALFDVNVVIALFDSNHVFHERAHIWFADNGENGWASCPLTENGVIRVMSNPNYSKQIQLTSSDLIGRLSLFTKQTDHEFWSDDISIRDDEYFAIERIHGTKQLTDIYLLALAKRHGGRLVTFDQGIPLSAVIGARAEHLTVV
jgi:toxin-antitoxin system PIN domain toxin